MTIKSIFYYSDNAVPDNWTAQAFVELKITHSIASRCRLLEIFIPDPKNTVVGNFFDYQRVKIVESQTSDDNTIFLGRIEQIVPNWDGDYGQILKLTARDYLQELTERKLDTNFSSSQTRSALISDVLDSYTYIGTSFPRTMVASGSSAEITKDMQNTQIMPLDFIEELAGEDSWTNSTWAEGITDVGACWRWDDGGGAWVNDTTEANSAGGAVFNWMDAIADYRYLGCDSQFCGARFDLDSFGNYTTAVWQYYNGTTWATLTPTQAYTFGADGFILWDPPAAWRKLAFDAGAPHAGAPPDTTKRYWVKMSVAAIVAEATVFEIDLILTPVGAVWMWDSTGEVWVDDTAEADTEVGVPFPLFGTADDYRYYGTNNPFVGLTFNEYGAWYEAGNLNNIAYEYWNGSTWVTLIPTNDPYANISSGPVYWEAPTDWATGILADIDIHGSTPDSISRYWVRETVESITVSSQMYSITIVQGNGYDYYIDDSSTPVFYYFRRGSSPAGGAEANGLTIEYGGTSGYQVRPIFSDYSLYTIPQEVITRVTVRGTNSDGENVSATEINTTLETSLGIIKEYTDFIYGATTTAECTAKAKAILQQRGNAAIQRGECKIPCYPYYNLITTVVLRPTSAGDETNLSLVPGAGEENWEDVDDIIADDVSTYVYNNAANNNWVRDLYNVSSDTFDTIFSITIYAKCDRFHEIEGDQTDLRICLKTVGEMAVDGTEQTIAAPWTLYSQTWTTNPRTGVAWTQADLDNLQIGVSLRRSESDSAVSITRCTQLYVEVITGSYRLVKAGDLVRAKISSQSVDADMLVLEIVYHEPTMMTALKLLSNAWGRGYATVELASIIKTLREGLSIPMARIGDLLVGDAHIANLSADKITAGTIKVWDSIDIDTGTLGGANIHIDSTGIEGYNSGDVQKFELSTDGSGWFGNSGSFSWDTDGIVSIDGATLQTISVESASIHECSIDKLITGDLTAIGTITSGYINSGDSPNPRISIGKYTIDAVEQVALVGFSDATTMQFYLKSTDGKAYCGAGTIILDSAGLKVKGQVAEFQDNSGYTRGYIYGTDGPAFVIAGAGNPSAEIWLSPGGLGITYSSGHFIPTSDLTKYLGDSGSRWLCVYGNPILDDGSAEGEAVEGALSRSGGANGILYVYVNGAWRLNDV